MVHLREMPALQTYRERFYYSSSRARAWRRSSMSTSVRRRSPARERRYPYSSFTGMTGRGISSPSRSIHTTFMPGAKPYFERNGSGIVTCPLVFTVVVVLLISYGNTKGQASQQDRWLHPRVLLFPTPARAPETSAHRPSPPMAMSDDSPHTGRHGRIDGSDVLLHP